MKSIFSIGPIENSYYVIESKDSEEYIESDDGIKAPMYWSNDDGWVPYYFCDHFDKEESAKYSPADGGVWKKVNSITNFVLSKGQYTVIENVEIDEEL